MSDVTTYPRRDINAFPTPTRAQTALIVDAWELNYMDADFVWKRKLPALGIHNLAVTTSHVTSLEYVSIFGSYASVFAGMLVLEATRMTSQQSASQGGSEPSSSNSSATFSREWERYFPAEGRDERIQRGLMAQAESRFELMLSEEMWREVAEGTDILD